jgi:hypothetical protein
VAAKRRDQQKLWLILFQIKAIRVRLNSLAAQYLVFSALGIMVAAAALIVTAALLLGPLSFLSLAVIVVFAAVTGVVRVTRGAIRMHASPLSAAAIADERAGLKGRLMTVLELAEKQPQSVLWPYLVEDTYGHRNEFEPGKIEPRWLSRSILGFIAACLCALLMLRFAHYRWGSQTIAAGGLPGEMTAEIGNLDIQPADPALQPNAEIYADQATMQKLADKLASQEAGNGDKGGLSQWMGKARNLAGALQNEITGNHDNRPPLRLRLTDKAGGDADRQSQSHGGSAGQNGSNQANTSGDSGSHNAGNGAGQTGSPESLPAQQADQFARNGAGFPGEPGGNPAEANPSDSGAAFGGGTDNGGGSSHGSGSDPEHLFGPESAQPLGNDSFKITIDAPPSDESSTAGAPAYIPPKVKVPLNGSQYPDEPIARAAVPASDQTTIKRVFAR